MKKIVIGILLLFSHYTNASHIVGGEFQMVHLSGYRYRFNLIIYFDEIQGSPPSKDDIITARIFRNSDNAGMLNVSLPLSSEVSLGQSQPACAVPNVLRVRQLTYTVIQTLNPEIFNDPKGYYIVWERCCRNYSITNIYSNDPTGSPSQAAGQTFYLSFPPVVKDATFFTNSSPELPVPLIDYACVNRLYYADFAGIDQDDDSLVYSLTTPFSTHTYDAFPPLLPWPYPVIVWRPSYSLQNIMSGNPDLRIDSDGLITVQPSHQGLFAFALKCEEYRDGIKIGEVRREYQLMVLDCPVDEAPDITAKSATGSYSNLPLDVHFDSTVPDDERCIQVKVTDMDILTEPSEAIRIRVIPIGFKDDLSGFLPATSTATLSQQNPFAEFSICFDRCPPTTSNSFQIGILAFDEACSIPITDTVYVNVSIDGAEGECLQQSIDFPVIEDKTLGDPPFALNATASSGLLVQFAVEDGPASVANSILTLNNAGLVTINASQSGNDSYRSAITVRRKFCVNPQPPVLSLSMVDSSLVIHSSSQTGNVWFKDGILQNGLVGNSVEVTGPSAGYTARVVVGYCSSEASNNIIITGIGDESLQEVQIFPNPTSSSFYLFFAENREPKTITVYDMKGLRIFHNKTSEEIHSVMMDGLEAGIYLVRIEIEGVVYMRKVFKNK